MSNHWNRCTVVRFGSYNSDIWNRNIYVTLNKYCIWSTCCWCYCIIDNYDLIYSNLIATIIRHRVRSCDCFWTRQTITNISYMSNCWTYCTIVCFVIHNQYINCRNISNTLNKCRIWSTCCWTCYVIYSYNLVYCNLIATIIRNRVRSCDCFWTCEPITYISNVSNYWICSTIICLISYNQYINCRNISNALNRYCNWSTCRWQSCVIDRDYLINS